MLEDRSLWRRINRALADAAEGALLETLPLVGAYASAPARCLIDADVFVADQPSKHIRAHSKKKVVREQHAKRKGESDVRELRRVI